VTAQRQNGNHAAGEPSAIFGSGGRGTGGGGHAIAIESTCSTQKKGKKSSGWCQPALFATKGDKSPGPQAAKGERREGSQRTGCPPVPVRKGAFVAVPRYLKTGRYQAPLCSIRKISTYDTDDC